MKEMIKKLQKRSNKKGFTLVEIIVVLVILAILAAIAVPAVLGYVNDAKESKYISEARAIYIVVQTEEAKFRAENGLNIKSTITYGDKSEVTTVPSSTNNGAATIKTADVIDTAKKKTDLNIYTTDGISYTAPTGKDAYYTFHWTSGDNAVRYARVYSNKEVKIYKTAPTE